MSKSIGHRNLGPQFSDVMMNLKTMLWSLLGLFFAVAASAEPGDTTWVQTFTWEEQDNPATAYDSPGRRWFDFPSWEDTTYRKILMYHRLKCFENGTAGNLGFPCGEWDYLTYNWLFDHTGELDSTAVTHPMYLANDEDFDSISLVLSPDGGAPSDTVMEFLQRWSHAMPDSTLSWLFPTENEDLAWDDVLDEGVRHQWLWTSEELDSMAWGVDEEAWRLELPRSGNLSASSIARATLRARWTSANMLDGMVSSGWFQLVDAPLEVGDFEGTLTFDFGQPLIREEGMNLLLDLVVEGVDADGESSLHVEVSPVADTLALKCNPNASDASNFVHLDGGDRLEIDPSALFSLDTTVTIECWVRGNAAVLPANTTLFEGVNESGNREINAHVPWSDSRIYWDCGHDGGYDRIEQVASSSNFEGKWVHWAFTKNAESGVMKMFVNGNLWHSGSGKDNPIGEVVTMNLGGSAWATNDYHGDIAGFRVWGAELGGGTLSEWMDQTSSESLVAHPYAQHLLGAMNMMGENGEANAQGALGGWIHGDAGRFRFDARDAFLDPQPWGYRPLGWLEGGATPLTVVDTVLWADVRPIAPISMTEWAVVNDSFEWIDLHYGWHSTLETVTLNANGDTLGVYPIQGIPTSYVNSVDLVYWSEPFEVVDRYEL